MGNIVRALVVASVVGWLAAIVGVIHLIVIGAYSGALELIASMGVGMGAAFGASAVLVAKLPQSATAWCVGYSQGVHDARTQTVVERHLKRVD